MSDGVGVPTGLQINQETIQNRCSVADPSYVTPTALREWNRMTPES